MKIKNLKFYAQMMIIAGGIIFIKNNINTQIEEMMNSYNAEIDTLKEKDEKQNARLESLEQRIDTLIENYAENRSTMAQLTQKNNQMEKEAIVEEVEETSKEVITQLLIALEEDGSYGLHFYKERNIPSDYMTTKNLQEELQNIKDVYKKDIQIVYFDGCKDKRVLENLIHFKDLRRVSIEDCEFSDLSEISTYQNLEFLRIVNCNNLENITPLANLSNLRTFILNDTQVKDVSPLASLHNLETIDLRANQITDPSVLSNLTNLYCISLEGNDIKDDTTLKGLIESNLISAENISQIVSTQGSARK